MSRKRPQLYPTRHLRGFLESSLRELDRIPFLNGKRKNEGDAPSDVAVSVLIPTHPKDLWIGRHAVAYLKKNLQHPISEILIVSPRDEKIREWCEQDDLKWVDENEVIDWSISKIEERLPDWAKNRKGWMFQQLIKLSADQCCREDHILVLDADTLLLYKKAFISNGKLSLDYSHERNLLYLKAYRHLLGEAPASWVSFVTHFMFMEKSVLKEMKEKISSHCGKEWDEAIVSLASEPIWSRKELAIYPFNFFSEYEIYGNYVKRHNRYIKSRYFRNYSPQNFDKETLDIEKLVADLPSFYHWVSFHSYNGMQS